MHQGRMNTTEFPRAMLPRLRSSVAQAHTLIARHGLAVLVSLSLEHDPDGATVSPPTHWHLGLSPGVSEAVYAGADYWAEVEWAGARLNIGLPAAALRAWVAAQTPGLLLGELPQTLAAAALETLLAAALAGLGSVASSGPMRVLRTDADAPGRLPHAWTLAVCAQDTGDSVYAALGLDDLGLMLLAGVLAAAPPLPNDLDAGTVPVNLRAHIGSTALNVAELAGLEPGDVVLLDEYRVNKQGELWLVLDNGQAVRVRAQAASYVVTQAWSRLMSETPPSQENEPQAPLDDAAGGQAAASTDEASGITEEAASTEAAVPLDIDSLPVSLSFDLGDRRITLADLQRLQPGEVFDLQRPLDDGPVMIRANGALVGTGELVDIDGRVGVMVRTLGKGRA